MFLGSWSTVMLPDMGLNTPLIAFLLCCQNACLWMVFHSTNSVQYYLQPTEFMVGNCLGITIGSALLAMVFSNYFRNISRCDVAQGHPVFEYFCGNPRQKAKLASVSFWSGLVFWLEFLVSILIAMGKQELIQVGSQNTMYEHIDGRFSEYSTQQQPQQHQQQSPQEPQSSAAGFLGTFAGSSFQGSAYSTVPDINTNPAPSVASTGGYHNSGSATNNQQAASPQSSATINNPLGNV
eukprot:Sro210_g087530.2  (237) ;mRNA; f:14586-15296